LQIQDSLFSEISIFINKVGKKKEPDSITFKF
jgi:hypothetical protein